MYDEADVLLGQADGKQAEANTARQQADEYAERAGILTAASVGQYFVHDPNGRLIGRYDEKGDAIREYFRMGGTPIAVAANYELYYIRSDHLGTPRLVSGPNGAVVWSWISNGFGDSEPNEDADQDGEAFRLNLRFAGQHFDAETGFYHNWHRDYEPSSGRYITSDPIGLNAGQNTYIYAIADPIGSIDPFGLIVPGSTNTPPGAPDQPSSATSPAIVPNLPRDTNTETKHATCKGRWVQVDWERVYNVVCQCVWLCMSCEFSTVWSGNRHSPYLPRTMGTVFFDATKSGSEFNPTSGNNCICRNKPGPEKPCNDCND